MTVDHEALRQQTLLKVLWRQAAPAALAGWVQQGPGWVRGLQAHQAHAAALAGRALAAAFPTVRQLLGETSFTALARAFWQSVPPVEGDIHGWGASLPDFVANASDLAGEPYLADLARLEWAVHGAASAADETTAPFALHQLAALNPVALCQLCLLPKAGVALVESKHPVVSIWQAHAVADAPEWPVEASAAAETLETLEALEVDRFAAARAALAQQRAEPALVWRSGWRVQVAALGAVEADFTRRVLQGVALGGALQAVEQIGVETGFDFQAWLLLQLQRGWLAGAGPRVTG